MNNADLPPMSLQDWYVLAWERRTTLFGYGVMLLGALAAENVFRPGVMKWLILANGVVTAGLGHYNNSQIKRQEIT